MNKEQEKKIYKAASNAGFKHSSANPSVMTNSGQIIKRLTENNFKVGNDVKNGYTAALNAINKVKK